MAENCDTISREAAMELTDFYWQQAYKAGYYDAALRLGSLYRELEDLPAADVRPVVLCKDCVYSDKWYADRLICYLWNEHDGNSVFEDGFCNYGEKREES